VLLPELVPFICQSEGFYDFAVKTSAGSLSPRTNWSHLANYEFPLPPVDEQRRIADLLWAADDSITEYQNTLDKLQITAISFLETQIADGVKNDWKPTLFDELLTETQYGISKKSGLQRDGTVPILGIPNVIAGDIDLSKLSWVEAAESEFEKYKLKTDDILIVRTNGNPNYVGRCVALKNIPENSVYASYLIRLRVLEDRANPSFIEAVLNSNYMRRTLMNEIRSSAGNYNLNTQGIRKQKIPLPSLAVQESIMKTLNEFNSSKKALEGHIENSKKLKSNLLNKLLSN
jgi:restriction endonuclease S subunit